MSRAQDLEGLLEATFPRLVVNGNVAPHACAECDALNARLAGITWRDVPLEFIEENDGALPLLSDEAYLALLPAWLLAAIRNPDGPAAGMVPIALEGARSRSALTDEQAAVIVDVVDFVACASAYGRDDSVNQRHLEDIRRIYGREE
jgi:hypothetical protein